MPKYYSPTTENPIGGINPGQQDPNAIEAEVPNLRFGYSGLNKIYRKRALDDEIMLDKQTGEMLYKRVEDGKIVSYVREKIDVHNYMTQLKILMEDNAKEYIRPSTKNCSAYSDTHFVTTNIDLLDFDFHEDDKVRSMLDGSIIYNPHKKKISFTQETNGVFFFLQGRPRDQAVISILNSFYNAYYKNYDGDDPDILAIKEKYEEENSSYELSQAVVNYTIGYYQNDGTLYAETTDDGLVRVNELSYVPFPYKGIYPREEVAYAKIQINSISVPKLASALNLMEEHAGLNPGAVSLSSDFTDNIDLEFQTLLMSTFITTTDPNITPPIGNNMFPSMMLTMEELEVITSRISTMASASGIYINPKEPDEVQWSRIKLWVEPTTNVYATGEVEELESDNNMDILDKYFGKTETKIGGFTLDETELDQYYIETVNTLSIQLPW